MGFEELPFSFHPPRDSESHNFRDTNVRESPELKLPCASTVGDVLKRRGLITPRKRRRSTMPHGSPLRTAAAPNEIWCADFKGQFRLGSRRYCYPLTITDRFSRFLIKCEALEGTHVETAISVFDQAFREYGLPTVIRTDNGTPFAAPGLWGLSKLSARWLRLGIYPERIAPAHPEQNGQHERMHLVLKQETTRPAGDNFLQQQERNRPEIAETSDLTQREFAAERGVSFSNLRNWIYKLRKESRPLVADAPKVSGQAPERGAMPEGSRLLPVRVVASASKTRTTAVAVAGRGDEIVEIALPSGVRVRFTAGTDLKYLRALTAAL